MSETDDKATKDTVTDPEFVSFVALRQTSLMHYLAHGLLLTERPRVTSLGTYLEQY
jgi:hypothetical protein